MYCLHVVVGQQGRVSANLWQVQTCSPVRALFSSLALSLHPERANVWAVPLVVRGGPGQLHQEVAGSLSLPHGASRVCLACVGQLGLGMQASMMCIHCQSP